MKKGLLVVMGCWTVGVAAACNFTVSFDTNNNFSPCPPGFATFYNTSSDSTLHWLWDFGDGETDTVSSPSHIYYLPGVYVVKLVASDTSGCQDSVVKNGAIVRGPSGNFSVSEDSGCVPLAVTISGTAQDYAGIIIDLGDGTTFNDSLHVSHNYLNTGTFYPYAVLRDIIGCVVYYPLDTIHCNSLCALNAIFETTNTTPLFNIYNNPASSSFTINIEENMIGSTAAIADIAGGEITIVKLQITDTRLDVTNLANGIYMITIETEKGRTTKKLVIEK